MTKTEILNKVKNLGYIKRVYTNKDRKKGECKVRKVWTKNEIEICEEGEELKLLETK